MLLLPSNSSHQPPRQTLGLLYFFTHFCLLIPHRYNDYLEWVKELMGFCITDNQSFGIRGFEKAP